MDTTFMIKNTINYLFWIVNTEIKLVKICSLKIVLFGRIIQHLYQIMLNNSSDLVRRPIPFIVIGLRFDRDLLDSIHCTIKSLKIIYLSLQDMDNKHALLQFHQPQNKSRGALNNYYAWNQEIEDEP